MVPNHNLFFNIKKETVQTNGLFFLSGVIKSFLPGKEQSEKSQKVEIDVGGSVGKLSLELARYEVLFRP